MYMYHIGFVSQNKPENGKSDRKRFKDRYVHFFSNILKNLSKYHENPNIMHLIYISAGMKNVKMRTESKHISSTGQ